MEAELERAFAPGDFHVAMHASDDTNKVNGQVWTVAFGDGYPGNMEMLVVDAAGHRCRIYGVR